MGLICISRMSYNKFFFLMSGTFLVHAFFGPVWCIRWMAFCIGICLWMGSLVSSKPIPAAITVLIAFTLTGLRRWTKKVDMSTNTSYLVKFNESIEQRLDGIERKLDLLMTRLNDMNHNVHYNWKKKIHNRFLPKMGYRFLLILIGGEVMKGKTVNHSNSRMDMDGHVSFQLWIRV